VALAVAEQLQVGVVLVALGLPQVLQLPKQVTL
jgi:hypothetical protein